MLLLFVFRNKNKSVANRNIDKIMMKLIFYVKHIFKNIFNKGTNSHYNIIYTIITITIL